MKSRREFLKSAGALAILSSGCGHLGIGKRNVIVNDVQSRLNETRVDRLIKARSLQDVQKGIIRAVEQGKRLAICGGRHAMGGQQFARDGILVDVTGMGRVLSFDKENGLIEVEAGIQWPELLKELLRRQSGSQRVWTFAQKQTGANGFCLGGSLGANIHSRGLTMKPIVSNIESFTLVDAKGELRNCGRTENAELFKLAIGGYGLFGAIYSIKLRLIPRTKLRRVVEVFDVENLAAAFQKRIDDGFMYGDFQFAIDPASPDFLRKGVFSCYVPVPLETPMAQRKKLARSTWLDLLYGAHAEPTRAFEEYASYYKTTNGQVYWSDLHQFSGYLDDFHLHIDKRTNAAVPGTEIITEIYVPRNAIAQFMGQAADSFRKSKVKVIYGTIRLIEKDDETYLAWARENYACIIFNLHTDHSSEGIQHSANAFRDLIDLATNHGGSYYLTYHKFAARKQLEACYPKFKEFLSLKSKYDPQALFSSDWYKHYTSGNT